MPPPPDPVVNVPEILIAYGLNVVVGLGNSIINLTKNSHHNKQTKQANTP